MNVCTLLLLGLILLMVDYVSKSDMLAHGKSHGLCEVNPWRSL